MPLSVAHAEADPPAGWGEFARRRGTFYHDPAWMAAIAAVYRLRMHFLAASSDGALCGVLPLAEVPQWIARKPRLVSLPFGYAAGVVATDPSARAELMTAAVALAARRGARRLEIKSEAADAPAADRFERVTRYATYRLDTTGGEDTVMARLHASTRRSIRKAERSSLMLDDSGSAAGWRAMAELQEATAHRQGTPSPPRRFFEDACPELARSGRAALYLARRPDGAAVAAITVWRGPRWWIYAFGASEPGALEYRPNHLLIWAAIRDAAAAGCGFDFGRAAPEQASLVEFKRRWGGEPVPLAYDYWPSAGGLHAAARDRGGLALAARVWSRLPQSLTRRASGIYRYLG